MNNAAPAAPDVDRPQTVEPTVTETVDPADQVNDDITHAACGDCHNGGELVTTLCGLAQHITEMRYSETICDACEDAAPTHNCDA